MPFFSSLRPYSRRFLVFTCFSRLIGSDARTMPSGVSEKRENLKSAENVKNLKLRKNPENPNAKK
jgi:hypothetical protein